MAARPGEEIVATLFGDIHYFYSGAEVKPRHHRFDKGSYVYLFENASERRCRIEIANHPGTEDQDAFDGFLDQTYVRYSYKHHCMVGLTVAESVNQSEWHLPTFDPRNENKYHYKLHALDIYFWTQQDALQFINGVRRVLPPAHVEILDEPPPPPQPAPMSHVVQKLENVAISESQGTAQNPPSQSSSTAPPAGGAEVPPPPPPPANFAPMAYNPAAPAAPESIKPREKTPPPDEDPLNPLAVAVAYDYQKQPFTPGFPPQAPIPGLGQPGTPGLPPGTPGLPGQHPGLQRSATMPVAVNSPGPTQTRFPGSTQQPPFSPLSQGQHQSTPPVTSPGLPPPPPPSGYPSYQYGQQQQQQQQQRPGGMDYSIHQQVYRPEPAEPAAPYAGKQEPKGKLEENTARFERGVSGMLKKFEKKFG